MKVKWCKLGELLHCIKLARKTALNTTLTHVYPGASRVCLALRNGHEFSFVVIVEKRRLGMARHALAASSPRQIFGSSSSKHFPHRGESMTASG